MERRRAACVDGGRSDLAPLATRELFEDAGAAPVVRRAEVVQMDPRVRGELRAAHDRARFVERALVDLVRRAVAHLT